MNKLLTLGFLTLLSSIHGHPRNTDDKISTDLSKVSFYLWTPEMGLDRPLHFNAVATAEDLLRHNFLPQRPTKVLSHGWNSEGKDFSDDFVAAYFTHPEPSYNVIGIDWSPLATWDNYFTAANNAVRVGNYAGEILGQLLINKLGQSPSQIHAIGHSLGGHLVGHFGRAIANLIGKGKIARVTSLDPAGPWFEVVDRRNMVSKDDAEFVDVIHTNSGSILNLCLSYKGALGHIDFYPNGGSHQAGCNDVCMANVCTESNLWDLFKGACSHGRVKDLYIESIHHAPHTDVFMSKSCDSWDDYMNEVCHEHVQPIEMGEGLNPDQLRRNDISGTFYLETSDKAPYSGVGI